LLQFMLVIFIVPPFALWGIDSYQRFLNPPSEIADVAGQKISEQEFAEQVRQQQERMRSMLGANFDAAVFDTPEIRTQLLEGMISQRLLMRQAFRDKLAVSDEQLREVIASIPAFQEGGKFSRERYEETVRREGYTPTAFEGSLRRDMLLQQLTSAVSDAGFASMAAARQIAALRAERREVAEYAIGAEAFVPTVKIEPKTVQDYYESNRGRFLVPEQMRVEFVVLNGEALLAAEPIGQD
jgi:peptidyl-prolyl cis-trans isomerase D